MRDPLKEPRVGDVVRCWDGDDSWAVMTVARVEEDDVVVMITDSDLDIWTERMDVASWGRLGRWDGHVVIHAADDTLADAEHDAAVWCERSAREGEAPLDDDLSPRLAAAYADGWASACEALAASIRRGEHRGAWMRGGA